MDFNSLYLWIGFGAVVLTLLVLDLGVFHRKSHAISTKEAGIWTSVWICLALLFNIAIYYWKGPEIALEFLTGYLIEYSLSVDNIFVFVVIFSSFCIAPKQQHRVLFWGILGAVIMRGIFIITGSALMERFSWIVYIFGVFLIFTGIKLGFKKESVPHPEKNPIIRLACRFLPLSTDADDEKFFIKQAGRWLFTPLFLVLLTIETTDMVFALDSIPAIFGITNDLFVIFTSNVFAILGLRSLYFLLARVVGKFYYLQISLAIILIFIGTKMLIAHFFNIPIVISLLVIVTVLIGGIIVSLLRERRLRNI
jgi:tellurite resistance protein TerC